ncbi:alpha-protein kinase 3 [Salvelinus namaycush]|uniref:non-specific serine/threonine protein kinase n=1 Tax=Salvelinus namaycush TaxID=8040 RepID=A0A8U1H8P7_SALNM|nr:alpha-protein kinase 3 [Salvelinus namaycush]
MTSRRPMTRSYSGNGRSGGSYNEEEVSSSNGRMESCNYLSNVRPENRSTLFGVMAQLTEDTQPVFETTLKSKAVSENCNVKLTCVVTGNPAPELTWYRDDMELDRYCGLPKYEIGRNGKTHTLQIYNCTVDDAAIYQASARNSKGIVSCSGVLEVGTMSEFKIHQRFFGKLKEKAENKKRELEESRRRGNENVQKEPQEQKPLQNSPIAPQRKRRTPSALSSPPDGEENTVSQGAAAVEPNGASAEVSEPAMVTTTENGSKTPNNDFDNVEIVTTKPPTTEIFAKMKMKISNGIDSGVVSSNSSHTGPGTSENAYDGGISLAQFLSETLHSQTAEEKKIPARVEETVAVEEPDGHPEVYKTPTEETVPMAVVAPKTNVPHKQLASFERLNSAEHKHGFTVSHSEEPPSALRRAPESVPDSLEHVEQKEVCPEVMISSSTETVPTSGPPALSEATVDQIQADPVPHVVVSAPHEPNIQVFSSGTDQVTRHDAKTEDLHKQGPSDTPWSPDPSSGAGFHMSNRTSVGESGSAPNNNISPTVNLGLMTVTTESEKEKKSFVDSSFGNLKIQEQVAPIVQKTSEQKDVNLERNDVPTRTIERHVETEEKVTEIKVEVLGESKIHSETQPVKGSVIVSPEPPVSPSSLRRLTSRTPPVITVDDPPNSEKAVSEQSGGDTPTSSLSCESSPRLKRRDSLTLIRSATPEELASGARRKIFIPREGEGVGVVVALGVGGSPLDTQVKKEAPYMSPSQARRAAFLQAPAGSQTPPLERRSPLLSRRKATLEVPKVVKEISTEEPESPKTEVKPPEKEKQNPFKAPQVIRKIRGEPFPDASGHLKLWCQFFNVLSDSTIKWYRDEEEIVEVKRSGGDESQVALAIVQTSSRDCGVYGCSIKNEFGTDSTDFLLSVDLLSEYFLREDLEVGEEMEMTPMLFTKGLADPGYWGEKFFGRIMTQEAHLGEGCAHKACRAKVIYGLDPVFESGTTCIIKLQSPIAYGTKQESNLAERNMEITKQECKIQNTVREYCKIFAAEARVIENFGFSLEVSPLYLVYRPANSVPYATVEADLKGIFLKYCMMDAKGRLITRATSEVEMKCCSFQHWIHQWTNSNLLVTGLEGVGPKITKVRIVTKSKGYQGLTEDGSPKVFEQFLTQHQCNYYCGLLSLRTLKPMDTLQQPPKIKGSRSPLLVRKLGSSSPQLNRKLGSSSPQLQRKGLNSPLTTRKATSSPKVPRKTRETEDNQSTAKPKAEESLKVVV